MQLSTIESLQVIIDVLSGIGEDLVRKITWHVRKRAVFCIQENEGYLNNWCEMYTNVRSYSMFWNRQTWLKYTFTIVNVRLFLSPSHECTVYYKYSTTIENERINSKILKYTEEHEDLEVEEKHWFFIYHNKYACWILNSSCIANYIEWDAMCFQI